MAGQRASADCLLVDAPHGALIGRVDNSKPFVIGERALAALRRAGRLPLAGNTCCTDEAVGAFAVAVWVCLPLRAL